MGSLTEPLQRQAETHSRHCSAFLAMLTEQVKASWSPDLNALAAAESHCQE